MLLDNLFESRSLENPSVPLTGQNLHEYLDLGHGNGRIVTADTAMRLTAVYACHYVLSSSVAQLPLAVFRKVDGKIAIGNDHAAFGLLHDEPNTWQTSYKWRETKQNHVLGHGNGYTRLVRNRRGELTEMLSCEPGSTGLNKAAGRWIYNTVDEDGRGLAVSPEDMIHVRALGSSDKIGKSLIRQHAETLGLGLAAQQYGKSFFDGGGRMTGIASVKGTLEKEGWERLKTVWKGALALLRQEDNKTILLPADIDYRPLSVAPEEAQFIETRKMSRSEIASIYNVPPHMIGDLEKATFSNISEQAIQFVRHTMMPWVVNWEQELNRRIFTRAERLAGYYVKFNLAGLLRGTAKERAEFYHYAITDGWMDRNEVRAFEDMNPRDGLSEMLVSVNAQKSSQVGQPSTDTPPQ